MKVNVQIIGTETEETSPSVLVVAHNQKYLFNTPENSTRLSLEHNLKLHTASKVFLTHLSSDRLADIPSLILRSYGAGTRRLVMYGPENLANYVMIMRYFMVRGKMNLEVHEVGAHDDEDFIVDDGNVKIEPIVLSVEAEQHQQQALYTLKGSQSLERYFAMLTEDQQRESNSAATPPVYDFNKVKEQHRVFQQKREHRLTSYLKSITPQQSQPLASSTATEGESSVSESKSDDIDHVSASEEEDKQRMLHGYKEWIKLRMGLIVDSHITSSMQPSTSANESSTQFDTQWQKQMTALDESLLRDYFAHFEAESADAKSVYDSLHRAASSIDINKFDVGYDEEREKLAGTEVSSSARGALNIRCLFMAYSIFSNRLVRNLPQVEPLAHLRRQIMINNLNTYSFVDSIKYLVPQPVQERVEVICYVIHTPDIAGKFDAGKARSMGITGALCGKLSKGENVVLDDGRVIKPSDIISPSKPGPVILILDCPSPLFVDQLIRHPKLQRYMGSAHESGPQVSCVVHMTPQSIVETDEYKSFMRSFGKRCQHVIVNKQSSRQHPMFRTSAALQAKMNVLDPVNYPQSYLIDTKLHKASQSSAVFSPANGYPDLCIAADHLMKIAVNPALKVDTSETLPAFDINQTQREFRQQLDATGPASTAEAGFKIGFDCACPSPALGSNEEMIDQKHEAVIERITDRELEITFLGTGCSTSSKNRNVSCVLLNMFDRGCMLLDVGEGSYSQLYRKYGPQKTDQILSSLKCIWISHMHADHHTGIMRILHKREEALLRCGKTGDTSVLVIGPRALGSYLREFDDVCNQPCYNGDSIQYRRLNFVFLDGWLFTQVQNSASAYFLSEFGFKEAYCVPVMHAFSSFGLILTHTNGWKLVYSGDTLAQCQTLMDAGVDPTILIHESTFEDAMEQCACEKAHSTIGGAIETAAGMRAYRVLLTHFSQRYVNMPEVRNSAGERVILAFDFLTVNLKELRDVNQRTKCIKRIFELDTAEESVSVEV